MRPENANRHLPQSRLRNLPQGSGALREAGHEPRVVDYLKTPPDRKTLETLLAKMGKNVRDILRKRGTPYEELGLDKPGLTDDEIFAAIENTDPDRTADRGLWRKAALCRPAETLDALMS